MKSYSEEKLKTLSPKRQAQLIVQIAEDLLQGPDTLKLSQRELIKLGQHWCVLRETLADSPEASLRLPQVVQFEDLSARELSDLIYPLQRFIGEGLSDEMPAHQPDRKTSQGEQIPLVFVLDHLRSAHNVGSIFRLADGLGVERLDLIGYTPSPEDPRVVKTAMGTTSWVKWIKHDLLSEHLRDLQAGGYQIIALETNPQAPPIGSFAAKGPVALLVGNERFGLSEATLQLVDEVYQIPLFGRKNSLNVVNALSIGGFVIADSMRRAGLKLGAASVAPWLRGGE